MDSLDISDTTYSTTPLKSDMSSSATTRRQAYDRNSSNPYKTPIRCKVSQMVKNTLTKPNIYKTNVIDKMPVYSPPSKNVSFVKNPFEHARLLKERLSQPICSPSLFQNITSPSQVDQFSWSIEEISTFRPAQIDENPSQDFDSWFSPATENEAQEAINKFFSSRTLSMESPILTDKKSIKLIDDTPVKEKPSTTDTWSQTALTFPPVLPKEVEEILSSYCNFNKNQWEQNNDDLDSSNSSISRKKLLFDHITDDSADSENENIESNSFLITPQKLKADVTRRADVSTPVTHQPSSPELSPISLGNVQDSPMDISVRSRSTIRVDLTGDVEMVEKENQIPKEWNLHQGCSTPRVFPCESTDSAFSSL